MRVLLAISAALALAGAGTLPAAAQTTVAPNVAANTPISARGGWVAWSEPSTRGWMLMARHQGTTSQLPVARRAQPFDVNVGTDARGRAVATFSRCTVVPQATPYFNDGPRAPLTGRGCRIRVVDLVTGAERGLPVPGPADASDTSPSMWRGRVAFARLDPARDSQVEQVLLWSPTTGRLRPLPHGGVPRGCPPGLNSCASMPHLGVVQGLDLDSSIVTYLWWVQAPAVSGSDNGAWELMVDRLGSGRRTLVGTGGLSEACIGPGDDLQVPSPPVAQGSHVLYSELDASCYAFRNFLVRYDALTNRAAIAPLPAAALQLALDGNAVYTLVAPVPHNQTLPTCLEVPAPCQLNRLAIPSLRAARLRVTPPYRNY